MKNLKVLLLIILFICPIYIHATTYKTAYPYTIKLKKQNTRIEATPYAPRDGSPMYGKTDVFYKGKKLYSIDKYFRERLVSSNNGKIIVVINPFIYRYAINPNELETYDDKVINIFKNGKPYLTYKLNQLININTIPKLEPYDFLNCWLFKHNPYDSWITRLKSKKTENNNIFIENNILHIVTTVDTIVRIDLKTGNKLSDLILESVLPIKRHFNPDKITTTYHESTYPEKFILPKLKNGNSFEYELSKFLKLELADKSTNKLQELSIYVHTFLLNKRGACEIAYINSGNKTLDTKIVDWIKMQQFQVIEIPDNFEKFKFEDFIYLKKKSN